MDKELEKTVTTLDNAIEKLKALLKNHTHHLTDDKENNWRVVEASDIEVLLEDIQSIYNNENLLTYAGVENVRFIREETLNGIPHVYMVDKDGREKVVYKSLFEKYAKIQ